MATGAECNQILGDIPAKSASRPDVVNLQVRHGTAVLASPTISFQNLVSYYAVLVRPEPESWLPLTEVHRIPQRADDAPDGQGSSNLAPARKSAQIISRQ
jgi:hypothetical protein